MRRQLFLTLIAVFSSLASKAEQIVCPAPVTRMTVDKGQYSPLGGATLNLENFAANMVARGKTSPLCFTRTTDVEHGRVFISSESLTRLFAQKARQSGSRVKDLKVEIKDGEAHLSGKIHKGLDIPFDIQGPISSDGTQLILHAKKIKAEGIPVKGLLNTLGAHLSSLLRSESVNGVIAKDDTLIFEPDKIAHVRGKIASADLKADGLTIVFAPSASQQQSRNGN